MSQAWVRTNTRVYYLGLAIALPLLLIGLAVALTVAMPGFRTSGWIVTGLAGLVTLTLARELSRPRIGYRSGQVLLYLRWGSPLRVPIELVEGFLLGQGPSYLRGAAASKLETATLVVKIADRAEEWSRVDVRPNLAAWCNHYVTIRGTWCEPLNLALVERLNRLLAEQKQLGREPQVAR
jgi:hypothetical protein